MENNSLIRHRLHNQQLSHHPASTIQEAVAWLGAAQAQEYYEAKWSLALRVPGLTDSAVEDAFDRGLILRTHVMRPTWHFVTPDDIGWLLQLTAPRVKIAIGTFLRRFGLDEKVVGHSNETLARALEGGKHLTRREMEAVLREAGIVREGDDRLRFTHLLMSAELDGVICSGPRRGKQFTYALLSERAPQARTLDEDEALAELTQRFFTSHGPATEYDFSWWSGLTLKQVREGLAMVKGTFASADVDGNIVYFPEVEPRPIPSGQAWLLQSFDEYIIGYKDRSAVLNPDDGFRIDEQMSMPLVYEGRAIGSWRRHFGKEETEVTVRPFSSFSTAHKNAIAETAAHYSAFLEMPVRTRYLS